jgi:GNAT superfamily N-acetyltransferase
MDLKFETLFNNTISKLPEKISVLDLQIHPHEGRSRHSNPKMHDLLYEAGNSAVDQDEEIIISNLFEAIYSILHGAELFLSTLRPSELRAESVRSNFEKRLRRALEDISLQDGPSGWSERNLKLARKYFEENPTRTSELSTAVSWQKNNFVISTDKSILQIHRIHRFLSEEAYWCLGIPEKVVRKAIDGSLCFGLYDDSKENKPQVGFARIVTDQATFAWVCDVYIENEYRGQGLSKWLVECFLKHPELQSLRRICLATKDAHTLYEKFGFEVTQTPANWLEIKDNEIYIKTKTR